MHENLNEITMLISTYKETVNSEQNETLYIVRFCTENYKKCKSHSTKRQFETFCKWVEESSDFTAASSQSMSR